MDYTIHPAADVFPMLSDEMLKELAASISKAGLIDPITVNGAVIIDGRNRIRACEIAGVEPRFVSIDDVLGAEATEEQILDYIGAKNLRRRDLTPSQRAMIGAKLEPMYAEAAAKNVGGRPRKDEGKPVADLPPVSERERKSREQAAKAVGASGRAVSQAKALKRDAPDLADKVEKGDMTLNAATKERKRRESERKPKPTPKSKPELVEAPEEINWTPPQHSENHYLVVGLYEQGMAQAEIARQYPNIGREVRHIIEREKIERAAFLEGKESATIVNYDSFPPEKRALEAAMRKRIQREVDAAFEYRVQSEVQERMVYAEREFRRMFDDAKRVLASRKGVFTKAQFRLIQAGLHTDRALSKEKQEEVFDLFTKAEINLLGEKEDPRTTTLPTNLGDLLKRRKTRRR